MTNQAQTITQVLEKLHERLAQIDSAVVALRTHVLENPDTIAEGKIVVGRFPYPVPVPGPLPLPGDGECLKRAWPEPSTDVTIAVAAHLLQAGLLHCAEVADRVGGLAGPPSA